MNVGEMFVNLGIKGSEKTVDALSSVQKGMGGVRGVSLEAKAAIVAAFYAIGKAVSDTGAVATGFRNFNSLTGMSMQTLQQYNKAARQVTGTNMDMSKTFLDMQQSITNMLSGAGKAPPYLARVVQTLMGAGKMTSPADVMKWKTDSSLMMKMLQEYALLEKDAAVRTQALMGFGVGQDVAAGLSRGAFTSGKLSQFKTLNDKQINQLDRQNIAWSNIASNMSMTFSQIMATKDMGTIIKDVEKLTVAVSRLVEKLIILSEKTGAISKGYGALTKNFRNNKGLNSFIDFHTMPEKEYDAKYGKGDNGQTSITVNQTIQWDGKDPDKLKDATAKGVRDAVKQIPVQ